MAAGGRAMAAGAQKKLLEYSNGCRCILDCRIRTHRAIQHSQPCSKRHEGHKRRRTCLGWSCSHPNSLSRCWSIPPGGWAMAAGERPLDQHHNHLQKCKTAYYSNKTVDHPD